MWVESQPGHGSTFHFKVQFGLQKLDARRTVTADPVAPPHSPGKEPRRFKILLAEDNLVNQKVAVRLLEKEGTHGRRRRVRQGQALEAWRKQPFDLILMDVQMPEMDGFEASTIIRQEEIRRSPARNTSPSSP